MPTSPLKRPSAGARLGRLLASLRHPARAGPLPVQTGFPTSLADLVVKNHVRLKNPRMRHRPGVAQPSPVRPPVAPAVVVPPAQEEPRDVVTRQNAVDVGPKGAAFRVGPELLAVGGVVALALLVIWSKCLVVAVIVASVVMFGIDSVRSTASHHRQRPETTDLVPCGRGYVSPVREEAESEAGSPMSSCADPDRGSEVSSLGGVDALVSPKWKEKRRSLQKLIFKKLRYGKRSMDKDTDTSSISIHGGESKHPEAGINAVQVKTVPPLRAPVVDTRPRPPHAVTDERCLRGAAFPAAAFVPIILVGLVAGKLPAVALTVLCAVFFSSVDDREPRY